METNYELKHKCLLVPLKAVLLVLAMVLVGFTTYAQQGKAVKVADNQQLIEAMENPSIGTIELEAGYYAYLNYYAESGSRVKKGAAENGNREQQCTYFIIGSNVCFSPEPPQTFVQNIAIAGRIDCPAPGGCCPGDNAGTWTWTSGPAGSSLNFLDPLNLEFMTFEVNMPGNYILRYTWGAPWNSLVETEYYFYGPVTVELSAEDVCGLTTEVDFVNFSAFPDPETTVVWTLDGLPYAGPTITDQFDLTVAECGLHELCVTVTPLKCPPVTKCITIDFSCMPTANAGPDVNVCNDLCALLDGETGLIEYSPTYAFSWVQLSGPDDLTFVPDPYLEDVQVCRDADIPGDDSCPYGEYEVVFQVQNGQCYDEDTAIVRFYEQPLANAGTDQYICNQFSFNLQAVAYQYCGEEGVNYWSEHHWELVSQADVDAVVTIADPTSPTSLVTINIDEAVCGYGPYEFMWVENNSKGEGLGGCTASDNVVWTIFEDPAPDAGDDMVLCNTFEFQLFGIADEPCYENTVVQYTWEKSEEPGTCTVQFTDVHGIDPGIIIANCDPDECQYGEYIFSLTQANGYYNENQIFVPVCSTTDDVSVWILQDVLANAGADQQLCNTFEFAFSAIPTNFCGEEGVNYFSWGEWTFVSGPTDAVTIDDLNDPGSSVSVDTEGVPCPYGEYIFKWTEYNGFGDPFQGCSGEDLVSIFIYEQPDVEAGADQVYCATDILSEVGMMFSLNGTADPLCTEGSFQIKWELVSQPGTCDVSFMYDYNIDPLVMISNCEGCQYGEYVFKVTQMNGYWTTDAAGAQIFVPVCEDSEEVSVWIYEQPTNVSAGPDQSLCNDYTFDLSAVGSTYCGDLGTNYNNWYSWTLVGQPEGAGCEVTITNGTTLDASVEIGPCTGACPYGEFVFRFTEYNGTADVYCSAYDDVSIFIFEAPDADAGDDVNACVSIQDAPYCYDMTGSMEYCYSMNGVWTKSCAPGDVVFEDVNDPMSGFCVPEPGRYIFTWTAWNGAEGCLDSDEVIFDLLEQPTAIGGNAEIDAPCDALCIDLGLAEIDKYVYFGTDQGECPNYTDMAYWSFVDGPCSEPTSVSFADDTDPATELCVSYYGGYTIRWNEVNVAVDGESECTDFFDVFVEFYETPEPFAGDDEAVCGNCYTLEGVAYTYAGGCNEHLNDFYWWEILGGQAGGPCTVTISDIYALQPQVCIPDNFECYGTYSFVLHETNGDCEGTDTVDICFSKIPDPVGVCFNNNPNDCGPFTNGIDFIYNGCLEPGGLLEVCAEGWTNVYLGPGCYCPPGFDWYNPAFYGYTFEWSLISPAGTIVESQAGYYDFEWGMWIYPYININWGECCDTARLYLTITGPEGACGLTCENTMEFKFFVYHKPCVDIIGPDVAEVGMVSEYCNNCPPNPCLLYDWTAEHCGIIQSGQGTECIEVLWTDYNINGGWGEITLTVFDTCTGCCNYDEMLVKIYPPGTLGECTLSGHVYYHNNGETPLNGVEIQLWNGTIPVQTTTSFNDIEGGNGMGYYEFAGVNCETPFVITASYDAPWYGANATDALAVELKAINTDPFPILYDDLVGEAMDVNNINDITATDALWIKQRAINMVNYFPVGDWVFFPDMSSMAGTYDIYALNAGDANRSNIPNSMKTTPAIDLVKDGTMNVVTGQVFELPIRLAKASQFGAITLNLEYNTAILEVVGVNASEGMLSNISNGNVSIAWSNTNPMVLADNDVVVTLKVKAIGPITATESMFTVGMGSEFADASAAVIEPVTLKTYGITTAAAADDYFLSTNRPNPFSTSTFIEYTMPETGKVKLSVLDMLGQELAVLVDATQTAGSYTVEFSAAGLATGVYIYKISVDGETRDFISTQRMVISH